MSTVMGSTRPKPLRLLVFDDLEQHIDSGMSHQKRTAIVRKIDSMSPAKRRMFIADLLREVARK